MDIGFFLILFLLEKLPVLRVAGLRWFVPLDSGLGHVAVGERAVVIRTVDVRRLAHGRPERRRDWKGVEWDRGQGAGSKGKRFSPISCDIQYDDGVHCTIVTGWTVLCYPCALLSSRPDLSHID